MPAGVRTSRFEFHENRNADFEGPWRCPLGASRNQSAPPQVINRKIESHGRPGFRLLWEKSGVRGAKRDVDAGGRSGPTGRGSTDPAGNAGCEPAPSIVPQRRSTVVVWGAHLRLRRVIFVCDQATRRLKWGVASHNESPRPRASGVPHLCGTRHAPSHGVSGHPDRVRYLLSLPFSRLDGCTWKG